MRPGEIFGRYRMLGLLGRGGMAEVYLAQAVDGPTLARVALKRLLPHYTDNHKFVTMMRDEARIASAINHPNVARVYEFGTHDDVHYMVMEYVDGVDLGRVLRRLKAQGQGMPLAAALYIAAQVAHGLHAAHDLRDETGEAQGVIHRDVSPHNVLVSHEGAVKLIDFGVAKARSNSTQTRSGVIKGKLQYMSPEQAQALPLDARADVFSLGMTLYRLITGRLPFTGQTDYQIYDQILRRPTPPPRHYVHDLPLRVEAILLKALRKDRGARFASAAHMAHVIEQALAECSPGYGALDLAGLLMQTVVTATPEAMLSDGEEDDDLVGMDHTPSASSGTPLLDAFEVERLTRMEAYPEAFARTVRAAVAPGAPPEARAADGLPMHAVTVRHAPEAPAPLSPHGTRVDRDGPWRSAAAEPAEPGLPATVIHAVAPPARAPERRRLSDSAESSGGWRVASATDLVPQPRLRWQRIALVAVAALVGTVVALLWARSARTPAPAPSVFSASGRAAAGGAGSPGRASTPLPPAAVEALDAGQAGAGSGGTTVIGAAALDAVAQPVDALDAALADAGRPDAGAPDAEDAAVDAAWPAPKVAPSPPRRIVAPRRRPAKAAAPGYLTVNALPWAHVEVDGRRLAKHTPLQRVPLPAGAHTVTLVSPSGVKFSKPIKVVSGDEVRVVHRFDR